MASPNVDQLSREDILRCAKTSSMDSKNAEWTVVIEARDLPARPIVLTAAGVPPKRSNQFAHGHRETQGTRF
jgi:hypothetical protein